MGCKCSKHKDKEVEEIYSKYAVKSRTNTTTNTNAITLTNENPNTEGMTKYVMVRWMNGACSVPKSICH